MSIIHLSNMVYTHKETSHFLLKNVGTNIFGGACAHFTFQICDNLLVITIYMTLKKAPQK